MIIHLLHIYLIIYMQNNYYNQWYWMVFEPSKIYDFDDNKCLHFVMTNEFQLRITRNISSNTWLVTKFYWSLLIHYVFLLANNMKLFINRLSIVQIVVTKIGVQTFMKTNIQSVVLLKVQWELINLHRWFIYKLVNVHIWVHTLIQFTRLIHVIKTLKYFIFPVWFELIIIWNFKCI